MFEDVCSLTDIWIMMPQEVKKIIRCYAHVPSLNHRCIAYCSLSAIAIRVHHAMMIMAITQRS